MTEPRMTGTKTCSKCKKDLPVICFTVDRKNLDGLSTHCRDCRRNSEIHSEHYKNRREKEVNKKVEQIEYWTRKKYEDGKS